MRIIRDICSDFEEIGYERIENCKSISEKDLDEIGKMKSDFIKVLGVFIENNLKCD